jgi:hypothetical protein
MLIELWMSSSAAFESSIETDVDVIFGNKEKAASRRCLQHTTVTASALVSV